MVGFSVASGMCWRAGIWNLLQGLQGELLDAGAEIACHTQITSEVRVVEVSLVIVIVTAILPDVRRSSSTYMPLLLPLPF